VYAHHNATDKRSRVGDHIKLVKHGEYVFMVLCRNLHALADNIAFALFLNHHGDGIEGSLFVLGCFRDDFLDVRPHLTLLILLFALYLHQHFDSYLLDRLLAPPSLPEQALDEAPDFLGYWNHPGVLGLWHIESPVCCSLY
jgi:hypothetical protein